LAEDRDDAAQRRRPAGNGVVAGAQAQDHARADDDGDQVLMASDAPPDHFHKPQGFAVSLTVKDPAELSASSRHIGRRQHQHAVRQDLLLKALHVLRPVRHSLMVNSPLKECELPAVITRGGQRSVPIHNNSVDR
jgi:hypothetical protein